MAELWDNSTTYVILRRLVDFCTRRSYKRLEIKGLENIPSDGNVILAPNHCNTMMDALVMLLTRRTGICFGCRADLFKNPRVASILNWLKIVPVPRQRDGIEAMKESQRTLERVVDTVTRGTPFCLYSEGTHRAKHSLLPIKKGIFRFALDIMQKSDRPVYVVPVGLEYGDYYRYRSTLLMSIGEPIDVRSMVDGSEGTSESELFHGLVAELSGRMASLITYLKDDGSYEDHWCLVKFISAGFKGSLAEKLDRNKRIVRILEGAEEKLHSEMHSLNFRAMELDNLRRRRKVSVRSFGWKNHRLRTLGRTLLWLLGLPFFILASIASLPLWLGAELKCMTVKDRPFINSVRYCFRLAGIPVMTMILAVVLFLTLPWYIALAGILLFLPSYSYFYDYCEFSRILASDIRLALHPELSGLHAEILKRYSTLVM